MFIDRFYDKKQKITDGISVYLGGNKLKKRTDSHSSPDFPLVEILYRLYKAALYNSGMLSENSIITHIEQYRERIDAGFNYSLEGLIERGWIETCFGHYQIIGHRKSGRDEIFRNESMRCEDQDILRFIFWEDEQQPDSYFFLKREEVEAIIGKWHHVSDNVEDLNWFCEQDLLYDYGEKVVISSGTKYKDCITEAMGRLWNDVCREDSFEIIALKWLQLSSQTRVYSNVLEFIYDQKDKEYRGRLLELIMSAIRTDSKYVSEEIEHRKLINAFRFSGTQNLAMVSEHKELYSFKEHRSLRKEWGHIYDDNILWQDHQIWGDNFYLGTVIAYMDALAESDLEDVFGLLKIYADSGRLRRSYVNIQPDVFTEMLLHKETFYFAAIKLVENIRPFDKECAGIADQLSDIFQTILEMYLSYASKPATEDMLDFLLYIVESSKTSGIRDSNDNQFLHLYNRLTKIYLNSGLAKQLIEEAPAYFNKLIRYDHGDVDFGRCFYFLCGFTDCVISADSREEAAISALCEEVYNGICKILTDEGRWSHYIDTVCFSEKLSEKVYFNHILKLRENKKRKVLGIDFKTVEKTDIIYRYKAAIVFLTKAGHSIEDARLILQDYLQVVMVERKNLDFSNISIFNMEELMKEAFGLLERHNETSKTFFKGLLQLEIPELILCTGLLSDEKNITDFIEEIKERVAEADNIDELLPRFSDEKLIDVVLDRRIECLYYFVQKRLDWKLEEYRKRGVSEQTSYYLIADSQRKRLIYLGGDLEEINKTNDQFLIAAFKTENINSLKDYRDVITSWRLILLRGDRNVDSFPVCYNYLFAIYSVVERNPENKAPILIDFDFLKILKEDLQWIIEFSVKDEMNLWTAKRQETFIDLLIRTGVKLDRETDEIIKYVMEHTKLKIDESKVISIVSEVFKEQTIKSAGGFGVMMKHEENNDEDVVTVLRKYSLMTLEDKMKILAMSKSLYAEGKNWYGAFMLKTVIAACKALKNSVPYLVSREEHEKQETGEQVQIPPEDHISIVFRECYNMAYQEIFGVCVSDQIKLSTTGKLLKNKKLLSPAEVDMVISSHEMNHRELFEAFILQNSAKTAVYRDHMGKVMANNCDLHSPVFMLVYTFEERTKNKRKWNKYREYLEKKFEQDFKEVEDGIGIKSRVADMKDSDCYVDNFTGEMEGLDIIRQVVTIDENDVEIIHVLIDMSLSVSRDIRKSSRV